MSCGRWIYSVYFILVESFRKSEHKYAFCCVDVFSRKAWVCHGALAHGLAGSPVAHTSPLPSGADRWEFPGQAGGQGDWTQQSCVNQGQGQGTKDKETTDQGALYYNNRFLGDHIPGGGIDLTC